MELIVRDLATHCAIAALALWILGMVASETSSFFKAILIAVIAGPFSLIEPGGRWIEAVVMLLLVWKLTHARFFPNAIIVAIAANHLANTMVYFLVNTW